MDRRRFDREPTNLELFAQTGRRRQQRLSARDISTDGVFVEGWEPPPPPGARVHLTFLVGAGRVVKLLRREARVTRITEDGVGLVHGTGALRREGDRRRGSPWASLRWPEAE